MVWSLWRVSVRLMQHQHHPSRTKGLLDVKRADVRGAVTHFLLLIRWSYVAESNGQEWNGQLLEPPMSMTDGSQPADDDACALAKGGSRKPGLVQVGGLLWHTA